MHTIEIIGWSIFLLGVIYYLFLIIVIRRAKATTGMPKYDNPPSAPSKKIDFEIIKREFYNEHVTFKTTTGEPMVHTHPDKLLDWFKLRL